MRPHLEGGGTNAAACCVDIQRALRAELLLTPSARRASHRARDTVHTTERVLGHFNIPCVRLLLVCGSTLDVFLRRAPVSLFACCANMTTKIKLAFMHVMGIKEVPSQQFSPPVEETGIAYLVCSR